MPSSKRVALARHHQDEIWIDEIDLGVIEIVQQPENQPEARITVERRLIADLVEVLQTFCRER